MSNEARDEKKVRVLIVDDDPEWLRVLARCAELPGLQIDTANCGLAALKKLKEIQYDLLILDYYMTDMDGSELRSRIRADRSQADLPMILVTGYTSPKFFDEFEAVCSKDADLRTILPKLIHTVLWRPRHLGPRQGHPPPPGRHPSFGRKPGGSEIDGDKASMSEQAGSAREQRILLVDDNEATLALLRLTLARANLEADIANCGLTALKKLKEVDYDLVVTDWQMPDIDGIELCRRIRADPATARLHLIMITADYQAGIRALEIGADYHLTKPYITRELIAVIRRLLWRAGLEE